jgi:hypothetical protein
VEKRDASRPGELIYARKILAVVNCTRSYFLITQFPTLSFIANVSGFPSVVDIRKVLYSVSFKHIH